MTTPGGCTAWASVEDIPADPAAMHSPEQWCVYLNIATDVLWAATGRRWRGESLTGEAVLRAAPPRPGEGGWAYHRSWGHCACYAGVGILGGPRWADAPFGHHEPARVRLPHSDVTAVLSVTIDGAAFTGWRLDGAWLTRTDGRGWPECHDRSIVTYLYGRPPPAAGRALAALFAVELGRSMSEDPDQECGLPQRTQSVSRQGISIEMLDPMTFLERGKTGVYAVDVWTQAVNPHGRAQAAAVWSPDLARARSI